MEAEALAFHPYLEPSPSISTRIEILRCVTLVCCVWGLVWEDLTHAVTLLLPLRKYISRRTNRTYESLQ